jgi:hypothetical protein
MEKHTLVLRDYQSEIAQRGVGILRNRHILYLAMEVRCGKTATSFEVAKLYGAQNVLFLTKKKAIRSIEKDYANFGYSFQLTVINDESMHKLDDAHLYDLVIHDEHHRCFLGNTLIDGVEIKNIVIGDYKKSFNFDKKCYEYKRVKNVFKNKLSENLVKIKCDGKEIICTESHEIFTRRGWVKAGKILSTDELQMV